MQFRVRNKRIQFLEWTSYFVSTKSNKIININHSKTLNPSRKLIYIERTRTYGESSDSSSNYSKDKDSPKPHIFFLFIATIGSIGLRPWTFPITSTFIIDVLVDAFRHQKTLEKREKRNRQREKGNGNNSLVWLDMGIVKWEINQFPISIFNSPPYEEKREKRKKNTLENRKKKAENWRASTSSTVRNFLPVSFLPQKASIIDNCFSTSLDICFTPATSTSPPPSISVSTLLVEAIDSNSSRFLESPLQNLKAHYCVRFLPYRLDSWCLFLVDFLNKLPI